MSTLMMPAPTITTMTNPGPIPIAQHTKLEPKFVFTTNHNVAMIQQKPGKSQQEVFGNANTVYFTLYLY